LHGTLAASSRSTTISRPMSKVPSRSANAMGAFTHTAYNDFEIVAANLLDGESRKVSDRVPGYALFIDPPLGRAGMSEAEARRAGLPVLVGTRPMARVGRAVEKGETLGLMTVIADAETGKILGAAILGPGGDEAVHGILDAIKSARHIASFSGPCPSTRCSRVVRRTSRLLRIPFTVHYGIVGGVDRHLGKKRISLPP
jgi:Pyridine nucleotide-disulphide oxidoreductase, dimerisation domain